MELDSRQDAFEMRDFSLSSPWERLCAALEAELRAWLAAPPAALRSVSVAHGRLRYVLRWHGGAPADVRDLLDSAADFSSLAHPLARWFGFQSFVTLESEGPGELDESRLLLSSLVVAADALAAEATLPLFVPWGRSRPRDYVGYVAGPGQVVQMAAKAAFAHTPPSLPWLVRDFCRRNDFEAARVAVSVTVHCTWKSRMNPHGGWLQPAAIAPGSYHQETPWGPDLDPVAAVAFSTTTHLEWKAEEAPDSLLGAGEDPLACGRWSVMCQLDPAPTAPLTESVRMLLQAMTEADAEGFRSVKEAMSDQRLGRALLDPMLLPSRDEVERMIAELFNPSHPGTRFFDAPDREERMLDVKSAPPLTLMASLCMYLLNLEGLGGVAMIWLEFVRELRSHWDHFTELPRTGMPCSEPHRFCKIFQRLQMLNWCIAQRRERNEKAKKAALGGWDDDADFDSVNSESQDNDSDDNGNDSGATGKAAIEDDERTAGGREGARERLEMKLLAVPSDAMFAPETQDAGGVATEDMLEEQEALLLSLESSEMRAQLQSRGLISDMEAFRAANPGCILEDFVRWHSPKDWVVTPAKGPEGRKEDGSWVYKDEQGDFVCGKLSVRMGGADTLWRQLWDQAKPVPVSRQKPIVDHVREGERILSLFENMNPFQLLQEVILVALTSSWYTFKVYPTGEVPIVSRQTAAFAASILEIRGAAGEFGPEDLAPCVAELEKLECISSYAASMLGKLENNWELTSSLIGKGLGGVHVPVDEGTTDRQLVMNYVSRSFAEDEGDMSEPERLPPPNEREYILRHQSDGRFGRLYALLQDNGLVRLANAQSQLK